MKRLHRCVKKRTPPSIMSIVHEPENTISLVASSGWMIKKYPFVEPERGDSVLCLQCNVVFKIYCRMDNIFTLYSLSSILASR